MPLLDEQPAHLPTHALDDAAFAYQVERIRAFVVAWLDLTGLDRWSVHLCMMRDGEWQGSETALFHCTWQWEYQLGTIHANVALCARRQDEEVERAAVHELAHAWTGELADCRKASDYADHDEHATTSIATALWRVKRMAAAAQAEAMVRAEQRARDVR